MTAVGSFNAGGRLTAQELVDKAVSLVTSFNPAVSTVDSHVADVLGEVADVRRRARDALHARSRARGSRAPRRVCVPLTPRASAGQLGRPVCAAGVLRLQAV